MASYTKSVYAKINGAPCPQSIKNFKTETVEHLCQAWGSCKPAALCDCIGLRPTKLVLAKNGP